MPRGGIRPCQNKIIQKWIDSRKERTSRPFLLFPSSKFGESEMVLAPFLLLYFLQYPPPFSKPSNLQSCLLPLLPSFLRVLDSPNWQVIFLQTVETVSGKACGVVRRHCENICRIPVQVGLFLSPPLLFSIPSSRPSSSSSSSSFWRRRNRKQFRGKKGTTSTPLPPFFPSSSSAAACLLIAALTQREPSLRQSEYCSLVELRSTAHHNAKSNSYRAVLHSK